MTKREELEKILDCQSKLDVPNEIMRWASSWSNRPSKEQIGEVLSYNGIMNYSMMPADPLARQPYEAKRSKLIDELFNLWPEPERTEKPRVNHEILEILEETKFILYDPSEKQPSRDYMCHRLDKAISLLSGWEKAKPVWCRDITMQMDGRWILGWDDVTKCGYPIQPTWTACPICLAPRPKEKTT